MSPTGNARPDWRFRCRVGIAVSLLSACAVGVYAARERARREPRVFSMGLGFAGGTSYDIRATGEPGDALDRLIAQDVDNWVAREGASLSRVNQLVGGGLVCLKLTAPRLTRRMLGRLHEFPRDERDPLCLNLDIPEFTRDGFVAVSELTNLDTLDIGPRIRGIWPERRFPHGEITHADLAGVTRLQDLRNLSFTHVRLPHTALIQLQEMPHLTSLFLDDVDPPPEIRGRVGALTTLTSLGLMHMPIADADLAGLDQLAALERLWLNETQVTDAGLRYLTGLKNLREVSVINTRVTDKGIAELQRALPDVRITR